MSEQALKIKRSVVRVLLIILIVGPIFFFLTMPMTHGPYARMKSKQTQGKNALKQIGIALHERYEKAQEKGEKSYFPKLKMTKGGVFEDFGFEVDPFFHKPYKYSGAEAGTDRVAEGEEMHESLFKEDACLVVVDAVGYDYQTGEEKEIYYLRGDFSVMSTGLLKLSPEPASFWTAGKIMFLIWALLFFGSAFYLSKTQKKGEQDVVGLLGSTLFSVVAAFVFGLLVLAVLIEFF